MAALTQRDYKQILDYYKISIPANKKLMKHAAEKIISEKLCRCIKKLDPENESRSIGICTKTIFNRKGYSRGQFDCKKKQTVKFRKTLKNTTAKNK